MEKKIFLSQRVDIHPDYGERRDALDQKWAELLWQVGYLPVPVFSHGQTLRALMAQCPPWGILLTGGNSPVPYGGTSPERDEADALLIAYAVRHRIPLLGVCRGMQSVILYFGGTLQEIQGHVATRHEIGGDFARTVNSYHTLISASLPDELVVTGRSPDGAIEAIRHGSLPIAGIMWHPEREIPFDERDITLIRALFQ